MTGRDSPVAADALRDLVREVLREVLPAGLPRPASASPAAQPASVPASPPTSVPPAGPAGPVRTPGSTLPEGSVGAASSGLRGATARPDTAARSGHPARAGGAADDDGVQTVRLGTDEELHAFVLRVLRLADNPKRRRDILGGRLRFTLGAAAPASPAVIQRVDKGAVTERAVIAAAAAGARLVLGRRAVLTPLARDKARALGVPVEKER
jgi:hypothetical protein